MRISSTTINFNLIERLRSNYLQLIPIIKFSKKGINLWFFVQVLKKKLKNLFSKREKILERKIS